MSYDILAVALWRIGKALRRTRDGEVDLRSGLRRRNPRPADATEPVETLPVPWRLSTRLPHRKGVLATYL
jgi:hypothetical protein